MSGVNISQKLPRKRHEREQLRNKGQFWTPDWIAEAMVEYVIRDSDMLFDPATGSGAFYKALMNRDKSERIRFYGTDVDQNILRGEIYNYNSCKIELKDFIFDPPAHKFKSIVANPPYIRHHRLSQDTKNKLREISHRILGFGIDGRAGLHIYFLIQALNLLETGGRLAFIMPADTVEGVFAKRLWKWISEQFCLECVATFSPEATPFPDVDTNAIIFFIKKDEPCAEFVWVKSEVSYRNDLKNFIQSEFRMTSSSSLQITKRNLKEALNTGLSRPPLHQDFKYRLSDFASVMRGIATGANEFFYLTRKQAKELKINGEFLKPAIGRTRDVCEDCISRETLNHLDKKDRPTLLFSPDGRRLEDFSEEIQKYLLYGETIGINNRSLIKTRTPWYKMEERAIPKFLFAYLGRRNVRFIRNEAGVLPLSGFLCVFPRFRDEESVNSLWKILNHSETVNNLHLVGKSYGSGAIKVEPRSLENLPIPDELVEKSGLIRKETPQISLF